jgi:hypothetical protein
MSMWSFGVAIERIHLHAGAQPVEDSAPQAAST